MFAILILMAVEVAKGPPEKRLRWSNLGTPLMTATVAAYSGRLGDRPGDLSFDKFHANMTEAFPGMVENKQLRRLEFTAETAEIVRKSIWGARNVIANHLADAGRLRVGNMLDRMVELGGNDETAHDAAALVMEVQNTSRRYDARPLLMILSSQVVRHSMDLPSAV